MLQTKKLKLEHHPHLHALVPAGALGSAGQWVPARPGFLFPVHALSKCWRGKFLAVLKDLLAHGTLRLAGATQPLSAPAARKEFLARLYAQDWVVYAKPALAGPEQVLGYLARYTHKSALTNERILSATETLVRLSWRDRARGNRRRILALGPQEFLSRFLLHVLPRGFTRIRHTGFPASRNKRACQGSEERGREERGRV